MPNLQALKKNQLQLVLRTSRSQVWPFCFPGFIKGLFYWPYSGKRTDRLVFRNHLFLNKNIFLEFKWSKIMVEEACNKTFAQSYPGI